MACRCAFGLDIIVMFLPFQLVYLVMLAQVLPQLYSDLFETLLMYCSLSEDVHVDWTLS